MKVGFMSSAGTPCTIFTYCT